MKKGIHFNSYGVSEKDGTTITEESLRIIHDNPELVKKLEDMSYTAAQKLYYYFDDGSMTFDTKNEILNQVNSSGEEKSAFLSVLTLDAMMGGDNELMEYFDSISQKVDGCGALIKVLPHSKRPVFEETGVIFDAYKEYVDWIRLEMPRPTSSTCELAKALGSMMHLGHIMKNDLDKKNMKKLVQFGFFLDQGELGLGAHITFIGNGNHVGQEKIVISPNRFVDKKRIVKFLTDPTSTIHEKFVEIG